MSTNTCVYPVQKNKEKGFIFKLYFSQNENRLEQSYGVYSNKAEIFQPNNFLGNEILIQKICRRSLVCIPFKRIMRKALFLSFIFHKTKIDYNNLKVSILTKPRHFNKTTFWVTKF